MLNFTAHHRCGTVLTSRKKRDTGLASGIEGAQQAAPPPVMRLFVLRSTLRLWQIVWATLKGGRLAYKEARYTDDVTNQEVYRPYCHITPKGLARLAIEFGSAPGALAA